MHMNAQAGASQTPNSTAAKASQERTLFVFSFMRCRSTGSKDGSARTGAQWNCFLEPRSQPHSTTIFPLNMSIPHLYAMSRFGEAGSEISTASFKGRGFRMFCSGNTISFAQV